MQVRRLTNGEEIACLGVYFSSIRDIASRDYTPVQIAAWAPEDMDPKKWASHLRQLRPFVVVIGGEIAGYADVQPNGYIDHFFVSGHYPKQGIGTLLMKTIHDEARRLDLKELTSNVSKTAEGFFLRHGFEVVERGFPVRRGVTLQNALMRKELRTTELTDIDQS